MAAGAGGQQRGYRLEVGGQGSRDYSALQAGLAWLAASLTSVAFAGLAQAMVTAARPSS